MPIVCRCGIPVKGGKIFCSHKCQKAYLALGFSKNKDKKEWLLKNATVHNPKK